MLKLAAPISSLFKDSSVKNRIIAGSSCLECRQETFKSRELKQYLFHFDKDVLHPWSKADKDFIQSVIRIKKELKLISFHMAVSCSKPVLKGSVFYMGGSLLSRRDLIKNAENNISWLKELILKRKIEIAVENNNYYPTPAYKHIAEPGFISKIVLVNKIRFVFDLAHARISAHNKKCSYRHYVSGLPLKQMIQVHVSKSLINEQGMAFDAHELPDEPIFNEVAALAGKYSPEYLTIEYYKDGKKLISVLDKYRKFIVKKYEEKSFK